MHFFSSSGIFHKTEESHACIPTLTVIYLHGTVLGKGPNLDTDTVGSGSAACFQPRNRVHWFSFVIIKKIENADPVTLRISNFKNVIFIFFDYLAVFFCFAGQLCSVHLSIYNTTVPWSGRVSVRDWPWDELEHAAQILVLVRRQHVLELRVERLQVLLNQHLEYRT